MFAEHNSRSLTCRDPYGAVRTDTPVRLAVRVEPQGDTIQSVILCYAYGLEHFHEGRQRMKRCCRAQAGIQPDTPDMWDGGHQSDGNSNCERPDLWFESFCTMPSEPALFFYWFEILVNNGKTWLSCDHEKLNGSSRFSSGRPHYLPGESMQPYPFQITVYQADFSEIGRAHV